MAGLANDTFERVAGTLGAGWNERTTGPLTTNMSTINVPLLGGVAAIDAAGWHVATAVGTLQENQYVQCWYRSPNSSNNAGIVMRYIDDGNFYFAIAIPGTGVYLFRRLASSTVLIAGPVLAGAGTDTWHRLAGRIVGNTISIYIDQLYNTSGGREGPHIHLTDGTPVTGAGYAGITSSGNNATGASGPLWNDFIAFDGGPQVIHVDPLFNGGAAGEGMGTEERPDLNLDWALNNAGLGNKGTIQIHSDGPLGNGALPQFTIGHETKFADPAWSFPEYSDDNGQLTDPGSPNLTIESAAGHRTVLQETRNGPFFPLRADATGIVFRGLTFRLTGGIASAAVRNRPTAGDRSFTVDKCLVLMQSSGSMDQAVYVEECTQFRSLFSWYSSPDSAIANYKRYIGVLGAVENLKVRNCVFDGRDANLDAAIYQHSATPINSGDYWDLDHNHYVQIRDTLSSQAAAIHLDNPAGIQGTVEVQNGLFYGGDAGDPVSDRMDFGILTNTVGVPGSVLAHHNVYYLVGTPRDVGATDGGNEIVTLQDPAFPPDQFFTWLHTGNGFNPMLLPPAFPGPPGNLTPRASNYVDNADDSTLLQGVLDRGALQGYVLPAAEFETTLFCTTVVYDPGGAQEFSLGPRLMRMRPLRQEKDVQLRSYKASDTELVFADPDGIFMETNPDSFLRNAAGEPDWHSKRVNVNVYFGGAAPHRYVGFVLGVSASRGQGALRLGNRFQYLFNRKVKATDQGRTALNGTVVGNPADYFINVNRPTCRVETWTFRFVGPTDYEVEGSVTGLDGTGTLGSIFTSNSGAISVFNWAAAPFNIGDEVTITTEWRGLAGNFIDSLYLEFMLSEEGAGLETSDLDMGSIGELVNTQFDPAVVVYIIDQPTTVLDAIDDISRHIGAVTIEKANALITLNLHMPRIADVVPHVLCKTDDLMSASMDHLPIINEFRAEWAYDKNQLRFLGGSRFPSTDEGNESLQKYGRLLPAPRVLQFRGFDASSKSWVEHILAVLFVRYKDPRRVVSLLAKADRMDAELDSLYSVDSEAPDFLEELVELFVVRKDIASATVALEALDATPFIQVPGACGWIAYDTEGVGYDQCWGYL